MKPMMLHLQRWRPHFLIHIYITLVDVRAAQSCHVAKIGRHIRYISCLHVAATYGFRQCIYDCSIEYHNVVHVKLFCINLYHEMMHAMAQMRNVEG
ncbi:hypothetical protein CI102_8700 [Trichoderma harzianum]|uniref:Secreted protein n=1 Tax=Trichoderma harzianum CBS 226.95 TaxID=983964 RepID=A0A2T4AJ50_TRIHA|nr:hypothetical protein M431DRAFT_394493 [Trichoderma harzianum CBS 226.95]PKK46128.1 hypothetical protein CI102_8700 [Trichoderma harzianum]PTB57114.1 hypothetical protein M431DRAFT_394493 [Trichoderma harzianum CBS 226.95]